MDSGTTDVLFASIRERRSTDGRATRSPYARRRDDVLWLVPMDRPRDSPEPCAANTALFFRKTFRIDLRMFSHCSTKADAKLSARKTSDCDDVPVASLEPTWVWSFADRSPDIVTPMVRGFEAPRHAIEPVVTALLDDQQANGGREHIWKELGHSGGRVTTNDDPHGTYISCRRSGRRHLPIISGRSSTASCGL